MGMSGGGGTGIAMNHMPDFPRGNFSVDAKIVFPEGGMATSDTKPLLNLLLSNYPFSKKSVGYMDIGATDATKDLDVVDPSVMVPVYLDSAYVNKFPPTSEAAAGRNPPKFIMLRCLVGTGLLYMNVKDWSGGTAQPQLIAPLPLHAGKLYMNVKDYSGGTALPNLIAPLPLHAGKGLFMYAFPRLDTHYTMAQVPGELNPRPFPLALMDLFLRTFEPGNRFQLMVLR